MIPLLLLALSRRDEFGAGKQNQKVLSLSPLSPRGGGRADNVVYLRSACEAWKDDGETPGEISASSVGEFKKSVSLLLGWSLFRRSIDEKREKEKVCGKKGKNHDVGMLNAFSWETETGSSTKAVRHGGAHAVPHVKRKRRVAEKTKKRRRKENRSHSVLKENRTTICRRSLCVWEKSSSSGLEKRLLLGEKRKEGAFCSMVSSEKKNKRNPPPLWRGGILM